MIKAPGHLRFSKQSNYIPAGGAAARTRRDLNVLENQFELHTDFTLHRAVCSVSGFDPPQTCFNVVKRRAPDVSATLALSPDRPTMLTHDDQALVEEVAREFVERHGPKAVAVFGEKAESADGIADELAAKTWRDIADAAKRLLRQIGR
jgi:hypothetical protein